MTEGRERTLEAAGLYDPTAPDGPERLALLDHLLDLGVTIEEMAAAEDLKVFLATLGADRIMLDLGDSLSASQVAEIAGVSVERVLRVRLASGLTGAEDQPLPDWAPDDVRGFELASALFGEGATLAFTRVMGAGAARVAEAAVDLFVAEVDTQLTVRGASGLEWAQANEQAAALVAVATTTMTHLIREHLALVIGRQRAGTDTYGDVRMMAVGFVDLVNSTEWAASLQLREQGDALALFERAAWEIATTRRGRVVKLIGDEAMFAAVDPADACQIALDLCGAVANEPSLPRARGAVGFGEVVARDGDYFGPLVHAVARSVKEAAESQVVVDEAVATHCRATGASLRFADHGAQKLRGIEVPVHLFVVDPA